MFIGNRHGAPCTTILKKQVARDYLGDRLLEEEQVFGFTSERREVNRSKRYVKNNPELMVRFPLIEEGLTKKDCFYIIDQLGIKLPEMYLMGYLNANCTGCVKAANLGYWAAIREDFPEIFRKYAILERIVGSKDKNGIPRGAAINKRYRKCDNCSDASCGKCDKRGNIRYRVFLDELPHDIKPERNISFTCGYSCGSQDMDIVVESLKELTSKPSEKGILIAEELKKFYNKSGDIK